MKVKKLLSLVMSAVYTGVLLSSCSPEIRQIGRETDDLVSCLNENLENDDIKVADKSYGESGICLSLYGSDSIEDIRNLICVCDEWIENNQESFLVSGRLKISIELYLDKPNQSGHGNLDYVARISNYSISPECAPGDSFDCIDINSCDNLPSSFFGTLPDDYRVIELPSTVEFDDFDVLVNMNELEYLVICDRPFGDDSNRLEEKEEELDRFAEEYQDLHFSYCVIS